MDLFDLEIAETMVQQYRHTIDDPTANHREVCERLMEAFLFMLAHCYKDMDDLAHDEGYESDLYNKLVRNEPLLNSYMP